MIDPSTCVRQWCEGAKVIPVLTIRDINHAVPLAKALAAGGIKVIEITLRTDSALDAIARVRAEVPDLCVAVGTVRTQADLVMSKKAGAHFVVSPGTTRQLLDAAFDAMIPIMPGVASVSEIMQWSEYGMNTFKFFPAESSGGLSALRAFYAPLPDIRFCPTGGIAESQAQAYLALPNVLCVGGSWIVSEQHLADQNWDAITQSAARAMAC